MSIKKVQGFSIIELMIAMLIGLLLLTGAMGLFISNKRIYKEHDSMGRLQENARFAIQILIDDIRMAAFSGCADNIDGVTNNITTNQTLLRSFTNNNAIEGSENAANWQPSNSNEIVANITAGTDGITVRYIQPLGINLSAASTGTLVPTTDTSDIVANDAVAVSDCAATDIFQTTGTTGGLQHAGVAANYDTDAEISKFVAVRYYIRTGSDADGDGINDPALWRTVWDSTTNDLISQELIEGVEDMEILYGVDNDADSYPDSFVNAAGVTGAGGWTNVISVKLALLFRTIEQNFHLDPDTQTHTLLNNAANPAAGDLRRRKVVNATVSIRNRTTTS